LAVGSSLLVLALLVLLLAAVLLRRARRATHSVVVSSVHVSSEPTPTDYEYAQHVVATSVHDVNNHDLPPLVKPPCAPTTARLAPANVELAEAVVPYQSLQTTVEATVMQQYC